MFKKIAVVAMAAIMVVAVQATYACDAAKNASATETKSCSSTKNVSQVSATEKSCSSATAAAAGCASKNVAKNAASQTCTPAEAAACGAKKGFTNASAQYLCTKSRSEFAKLAPFSVLNEASCDEVHVGLESTENGFALVFTGVNADNVDKAMMLANKSMEALNKPAHCEMTRASMVEASGGCKATEACITALADCDVAVVEVDGGAKTVVTAKEAAKVKELHQILASVSAPAPTGDSE